MFFTRRYPTVASKKMALMPWKNPTEAPKQCNFDSTSEVFHDTLGMAHGADVETWKPPGVMIPVECVSKIGMEAMKTRIEPRVMLWAINLIRGSHHSNNCLDVSTINQVADGWCINYIMCWFIPLKLQGSVRFEVLNPLLVTTVRVTLSNISWNIIIHEPVIPRKIDQCNGMTEELWDRFRDNQPSPTWVDVMPAEKWDHVGSNLLFLTISAMFLVPSGVIKRGVLENLPFIDWLMLTVPLKLPCIVDFPARDPRFLHAWYW